VDKIKLELDTVEGHLLLAAINAGRLDALTFEAEAQTETAREYENVRARVLGRIETSLLDAMYPTCVYMHEDEPCGKDVAGYIEGKPFCRFHRDLLTTYPAAVA
jgi:hypothetical protein